MISKSDKTKLEVVFDKVIYVPYISPYKMKGEGKLKTIMMDSDIFKNCPNYDKFHPYSHVFFKLHIFNPKLFPEPMPKFEPEQTITTLEKLLCISSECLKFFEFSTIIIFTFESIDFKQFFSISILVL